jgi:5'-3' exonuclease
MITIDPSTRVMLIDTSYTAFFRYFAVLSWIKRQEADTSFETLHKNEAFMKTYEKTFEAMLVDLVKKYNVKWSNVVLCLDGFRADIWRFDHHKEYKHGRTSTFNEHIWKYTFESLIPRLKEAHGFHTLNGYRLEADDVVAICVQAIKEIHPDYNIVIITNDCDYIQLYEPDKVQLFNLQNTDIASRIKGTKNAATYLIAKCILGDKSDYIPSIKKGVGPKTAEKYANDPEAFEAFLAKNPDAREKYNNNRRLIDFDWIPTDLKAEVKKHITFSEKTT